METLREILLKDLKNSIKRLYKSVMGEQGILYLFLVIYILLVTLLECIN